MLEVRGERFEATNIIWQEKIFCLQPQAKSGGLGDPPTSVGGSHLRDLRW
jgi:hypothetical protein